MSNLNEADRRSRDEGDGNEDIIATVLKAQSFVNMQLMTEAEALKYFNLPRQIYERFKNPRAGKE
jgi:hypothetical protein